MRVAFVLAVFAFSVVWVYWVVLRFFLYCFYFVVSFLYHSSFWVKIPTPKMP